MGTNGPAARVIKKEDVGQIVAATLGQPRPAHATVIAAQNQPIASGGPSGRRIGKVDGNQSGACADVRRKPNLAPVTRPAYGAVICRDPTVFAVREIHGQ